MRYNNCTPCLLRMAKRLSRLAASCQCLCISVSVASCYACEMRFKKFGSTTIEFSCRDSKLFASSAAGSRENTSFEPSNDNYMPNTLNGFPWTAGAIRNLFLHCLQVCSTCLRTANSSSSRCIAPHFTQRTALTRRPFFSAASPAATHRSYDTGGAY